MDYTGNNLIQINRSKKRNYIGCKHENLNSYFAFETVME